VPGACVALTVIGHVVEDEVADLPIAGCVEIGISTVH
jgi:hypothetical protein